jgi:hypothetical protein
VTAPLQRAICPSPHHDLEDSRRACHKAALGGIREGTGRSPCRTTESNIMNLRNITRSFVSTLLLAAER